MSEQLVIRLGNYVQAPVQWLVWSDHENEIIASGVLPSSRDLSTLTERVGGRPIIALVPGSDFLLRTVTLPKRAGRKVLAALPFMLEDEISGDVDLQFFATGAKKGDEQYVAVVEKRKVSAWLSQINQAGLTCAKLLPDIFAVPTLAQGWSAMAMGGQLIIRQGQWQGIQGEESWLKPLIANYAKNQPEPLQLAWYSDNDWQALPNVELIDEATTLPMEILAREAMNCTFNLLQGEFKPKKQTSNIWKKWRVAAILAGVALLSGLIDKVITANQLAAQSKQLDAQIVDEFKHAFPDVKRVVNARSQMKQKLAELEQTSQGHSSILLMMSGLSDAFAMSQIKPQSLRFDSNRGELRMQAVARNFDALEKFKQTAESSGFSVQQGAINNRDDGVVGSLTIKSE